MFTESVKVSVAVWKMGVVLRQACSESQWTVLMGYLTISTSVRRYQTHHRWHFSFRKAAHWCTCIVRATQSNCCGAIDFLSPEPCPQQPCGLNALITRFRESYSSVSMSRESKRLKKSRSDWLNSGNALIQHLRENTIFVCPLPGSAEAQVILSSTVKRLLIAYFIGNYSSKNIKMFTFVKVIANQRLGLFWDAVFIMTFLL